jgi:hypothetical protein
MDKYRIEWRFRGRRGLKVLLLYPYDLAHIYRIDLLIVM